MMFKMTYKAMGGSVGPFHVNIENKTSSASLQYEQNDFEVSVIYLYFLQERFNLHGFDSTYVICLHN